MKKTILILVFAFAGKLVFGQNTFPAQGNVGIGTNQATSALHVRNDVSSSAENWVIRLQNDNSEADGLPTTGLLFAGGDFQSQKAGIIFRRTGPYGTGNLYFLNNNLFDASLPTIANHSIMTLQSDGNVGIGTTNPTERLSVNGKIRAKEIKVDATNWPDYVFEEGYEVGTLKGLESYIKTNKHLPEMPTAKEVETNGVAVSEMLKLQQKKIEELTLHLIELSKKVETQDAYIKQLKNKK
ncbi:hypothetical protein ACFSR6_03860 [Pedobacter vanadiisoli]|uniref:Uncharacterized protein n=1 Tax=Pedobacter vanadiisoli TaxID=1761975 RepID=A0ABW5MER2_9SPHI